MTSIFPPKLKKGDLIGVIAPARSATILDLELINRAKKNIEKFGLKVKLFNNIYGSHFLDSAKIINRVNDINNAFSDTNIKGIITLIGGYNTIQLLNNIDYNNIKKNPKIFCGYSDVTTLSTAIYSQTGLVSYSGPHFSTWAIPYELNYMTDSFKNCCLSSPAYKISTSIKWYDGRWYDKKNKINTQDNKGPIVLFPGSNTGNLIGGHLRSLNSLQGTQFLPDLSGSVLFLEEDEEVFPALFLRELTSLSMQKGFNKIKGILIGRFQKKSQMDKEIIKSIITDILPNKIPVIMDLDFGHTMPICTLPIGGKVEIIADKKSQECSIKIIKH